MHLLNHFIFADYKEMRFDQLLLLQFKMGDKIFCYVLLNVCSVREKSLHSSSLPHSFLLLPPLLQGAILTTMLVSRNFSGGCALSPQPPTQQNMQRERRKESG